MDLYPKLAGLERKRAGVLDGLRGQPYSDTRRRANEMIRNLPPAEPQGGDVIDVAPPDMSDMEFDAPPPAFDPFMGFSPDKLGRPLPPPPPRPIPYVGKRFGRG